MNPATASAMFAPDHRRVRPSRDAAPQQGLLQRLGRALREWRSRHKD